MTTFDPANFKRAMDKAPERLHQEVSSRMLRQAKRWAYVDFARARLSGRPGLIARNGAAGLKGSFDVAEFGNTMNDWGYVVFTTSKYAPIHEFGGVIKAKKAKYLHFKLEDGTWRMVKQVTIPPRLGFFDEWKNSEKQRVNTFAKAVDAALDGLN